MRQTVPLLILLSCAVFLPEPAAARDYQLQLSGWSRSTNDVDFNDDRTGGIEGQSWGTGGLGRVQAATSADNMDWDGQTFCEFDEQGQPVGILLVSVGSTRVVRLASGDLIYQRESSSPPSGVCFNFVDVSAKVESYYDIVGGTGKYAGATGSAKLELVVDVLPGLNGISGTETGQIFLAPGQADR